MCKCEAKTLSAACAGWRERRSAAGANVMAARRETAPLVNAGVRSAEQHANTTASKAASDTRMARSPSPSLRKEASLGLTRGISPLKGAPDKQLQGALCSRMAGVVIEHKKGEVNELKASLRNPSLDECCCSSARHSSFGGAGARVEVTRSLRRASKIGVLT